MNWNFLFTRSFFDGWGWKVPAKWWSFSVIIENVSNFLILPQNPLNFSLKEPKKYQVRRSNKENQQISIITSDNGSNNRHQQIAPQQQQQQQPQQQAMYDNRLNTHVKTYTDHGNNGHGVIRAGSSSHYSKVSISQFS